MLIIIFTNTYKIPTRINYRAILYRDLGNYIRSWLYIVYLVCKRETQYAWSLRKQRSWQISKSPSFFSILGWAGQSRVSLARYGHIWLCLAMANMSFADQVRSSLQCTSSFGADKWCCIIRHYLSCIFFSLPHLLIALSLSIYISVSFVCFYTIFCYMQIFVVCHNPKTKVSPIWRDCTSLSNQLFNV